jgi:hypothetical protein
VIFQEPSQLTKYQLERIGKRVVPLGIPHGKLELLTLFDYISKLYAAPHPMLSA